MMQKGRSVPIGLVGGFRISGAQKEIFNHGQWLRLRGLSARTQHEYGRVLRKLAEFLSKKGSDLLTAEKAQLKDWRESLSDIGGNSVLAYMTAVRSFYRWAQISGLVTADPSLDVPLPKRRKGRPRPISEEALVVAIVNAPKRIRPWLILAALAGLRAAEIAGLCREDIIDTADHPVMIIRGKGDKERIVPLSEQVWAELCAYGLPAFGPIFLRCDGLPGPNHPKQLSHVANAYLRSVGIKETLHQLRHRFGTRAYAVHRDLRVVQELLGHASPTTTSVYADWCRTAAAETVDALQIDLVGDPDKFALNPAGGQVSGPPDRPVRPGLQEGEPPVVLGNGQRSASGLELAVQHSTPDYHQVWKPGGVLPRVVIVERAEAKPLYLALNLPQKLTFSHLQVRPRASPSARPGERRTRCAASPGPPEWPAGRL